MRGKLHPLNLIPDLCMSSLVYVFFLYFFPLFGGIDLYFLLGSILFDEFMVPSAD